MIGGETTKKYYIIGLIALIALLSAAIYAINLETPIANTITDVQNSTDVVDNTTSGIQNSTENIMRPHQSSSENSYDPNVFNSNVNNNQFTENDLPKPKILLYGMISLLYIETNTSQGVMRFYPDLSTNGGGYFVFQNSNERYYPENIINGKDSDSNITRYCEIIQNGIITTYKYLQPAVRYDRDWISIYNSTATPDDAIISKNITTFKFMRNWVEASDIPDGISVNEYVDNLVSQDAIITQDNTTIG